MNALTVLSVAVLATCSGAQLLTYPGLYPGLYSGLYSGLQYPYTYGLPSAVTLKSVAPKPVTLKTIAAPAPLTYNVAPLAPVAPVTTQYHAQDEIGQYSFGYAGGPSSRSETRDAFGIVRGSYNYVDADGKIQTQHYVADALGFRVSATNLPVAPDAPATSTLAAPEPVQDTPEVAAAKAAHQALFDEAAAAAAAAPDTNVRRKRSVATSFVAPSIASPLRFSYGFSHPSYFGLPAFHGLSPFTYTRSATPLTLSGFPAATTPLTYTVPAAPAAASLKDATLLRVVNNPGHATSYHVV